MHRPGTPGADRNTQRLLRAEADRHAAAGAGPCDATVQAAELGDGAADSITHAAEIARAATEAERRRLARDLHDRVSQTLLALQWVAQAAAEQWDSQPAQARAALETVRDLAAGATVELRAVLFDLHDTTLEEQGLLAALSAFCAMVSQRSRVAAELHGWEAGDPSLSAAGPPGSVARLPRAHEVALYYVACEALVNVVKHARARRATVTLVWDATVRLVVEDDGVGFGPPTVADTYGLAGMRERVAELGGRLLLENRPSGGARVVAELPLSEDIEEGDV